MKLQQLKSPKFTGCDHFSAPISRSRQLHLILPAFFLGCSQLAQAELIQHLDATITASLIKDGTGKVTQWTDQSGKGNHAVAGVGTVRHPSTSVSSTGLVGLDFGTTRNSLTLFTSGASDKWMNQTASNPNGADGFCILFAFKFDGLSNTCDLFGNMSTINGNGMRVSFSTDGEYLIYWDDNSFARGGKVAVGDTVVLGINFESTTGRWTMWDSNQRVIQTGVKTAKDFSNGNAFTLGSMTSTANFFDGMVGEVKIFDESLSPTSFQSERDSLALKWVGAPPTIPPVAPGPGFPNVTQVHNRLPLCDVHPNPGNNVRTVGLDFVNGHLLLDSRTSPSGLEGDSIQVWNISNPSSPVEILDARKGVDEHMHTFSWLLPDYRVSAGGRQTYNVRDPLKIVRQMPPTGTTKDFGSRSMSVFPYQYAGGSSVRIFDTRTGQVVSEIFHGFGGSPTPIGNLLIVAGIRAGERGFATYDIGDPANPKLLDFISPTDPVWEEDDPAYEYFFWKHFLVLPNESGRGDQRDHCAFVNFQNPSNLVHVLHMPAAGQGDTSTGLWGRTRYAQFQDNKMFVGSATYDMSPLLNPTPTRPTFLASYPHAGEYILPLGNLFVAAPNLEQGPVNDFPSAESSQFKLRIFAHQAAPDTTGPTVAYHNPPHLAENQHVKSRVGVIIHETLDYATINSSTFRVFPVAGGPDVAGTLSHHDKDVLTFTPNAELEPETTYRVQLVAGGIKDVSGNGIAGYSFDFTTASVFTGPPILVTNLTSTPYPAPVSGNATLSVTATGGNPPLEYSWDFGDGTQSSFSSSSQITHNYAAKGRYPVTLRVRDSTAPSPQIVTHTMKVTVAPPVPAGPVSTKGSQMVLDGTNRRVWSVNPDSNTVTSIHADSLVKLSEFQVGADPRSIAQDVSGHLWVTCIDADLLEVRDTAGNLIKSLQFRHGARPHDIVFNPAKTQAYVTLSGSGRIARVNTSVTPMVVDAELAVGATPTALAFNAATNQLLVNRFISPDTQGEVRVVENAEGIMSLAPVIPLALDTTSVDSGTSARGLPNYLADVAIDPFNQFAYVTAKKDNILRGTSTVRDGNELTHETTVRPMVAKIDLGNNAEHLPARLDIDDSSQPTGMVFSPLGDYLFIALQGNNHVRVMDTFTGLPTATLPTGLAPQGLCFDAASNRLFVNSLTDRKVTVYDLTDGLRHGNFSQNPAATIGTVATETFPADVLRGKQIFYNASDDRMSLDNYLSCAVCHQDGDHDGRVWDFTDRGEGLRNTTNLRGRAGMAHGNVHWSGNFDEIQDFDLDMKSNFGGSGFIPAGAHKSMDAPNAGRDPDLDALAAYVTSLGRESIEKSPHREINGRLTASARTGKRYFAGTRTPGGGNTLKCRNCHVPDERLTYSFIGTALPPLIPSILTNPQDPNSSTSLLQNIGTLLPTSGQRLNDTLTGIDTPTLLGVHASAPYLHDGRAADLAAVFNHFDAAANLTQPGSAHDLSSTGYNLNAADRGHLIAYLNQIDGRGDNDFTAPPAPSGLVTTAGNGSVTIDWANSPAADIMDYNISRRILNGGTITTIASGVPTSIYVDNTVTNGTTYQYRLTAVDVNDNESAFSSWVNATPSSAIAPPTPTPIEDWRSTHFGSSANSGDAADLYDFDKDGLANLVEYAFGLDPKQASSNQLPQAQTIVGDLVISFAPPEGVTDITYGSEWSETLLPDSWLPITDTGSGGQHTFRMPMDPGNKFMRLKVRSQ